MNESFQTTHIYTHTSAHTTQCWSMDSDILNIEEIVMGRGLPDPPPKVPPVKPAEPQKTIFKPPPAPQSYQHDNLQCFQCFITFCNAKTKERHMKKSHCDEYKQQLQQGNTLFTCYLCDRSFQSSEELTQHQPTHSKEDKPFKCIHCKESFRVFSELTTHRRNMCPERQFVCKDCGETSRSQALHRTHRLAQHPRSDTEAACTQTPEPPVRAGSLAASDRQTQTETKQTIIRQQVEPDASSGTSAVCRASPQTTDSVQFVGAAAGGGGGGGGLVVTSGAQSAEHLAGGDKPHEEAVNVGQETKDAEDSTDDSEDYDDSLDEDQDGLSDESEGDYHCSVCDLQLSSKLKLQDHMNLHTGQRPHCCAECGKRFCQLNNYRAHLKTHANAKPDAGPAFPPNPLCCRICRKDFKSEEILKSHLTKTHFEKEFYECDVCKRVFTNHKECEEHIMVHMSNPGKFTCDKCGRRFFKQSTLQRHRARKCVLKFVCTDCDRKFARKTALLKHSFSHIGLLPYTCLRCSCHFRLPKLYRKHKCKPQRIHCVACLRGFDSQADFQKHKKDTGCWGHQEAKGDEILCPECGETFSSKEELRKHGGAHQRILTCDACGKGFRSALLLMSHMGGHASQAPCLCQTCGRGFLHQQDYSHHLDRCGLAPPPKRAKKPSAPRPVPRLRSPWRPDKPPPQGVKLVLIEPMSTPLAAGLGPALPGVIPPPEQPVLPSPAALPTVPQIMLPDLVANKTHPHCYVQPLDLSNELTTLTPTVVIKTEADPAAVSIKTDDPAAAIIMTEADPAAASIKTDDDPAAASIKMEADLAAASIIIEADPAAFSIKTDDPAAAIMTEADPAAASIKMEADPAGASIKTDDDPAGASIKTDDPAAANIKTDDDPAGASIKTDDDPAGASIKTDDDPAGASIKTEADPAAASIKTEADPAAVGIKAPIVSIALQPKYCQVVLRRLSDKELKR